MKTKNIFNPFMSKMHIGKGRAVAALALMAGASLMSTSCSDFFEQESDRIIYANDEHLNSAADTIYSVAGVISKLQTIADRTILLGELRGDLVDVNENAAADLRSIAMFDIKDDNVYNRPSDYYAIINNCNYFIAHADTALKNNRNEKIFMREYTAVKGFRAWTYLQLALNYGSVPFVTEPILTKEEAERDYPRKGIQEICEWLINDIQPLCEEETPYYGDIRSLNSKLLYFPIYLLLGELHLWAGSMSNNTAHFKDAALNYYKYISTRNGTNSAYNTGVATVGWQTGTSQFNRTGWYSLNLPNDYMSESYSASSELITLIPGDSIPSEGNYSQLRNLFNSTDDNNYKFSIELAQGMKDISAAQTSVYVQSISNGSPTYGDAPKGLGDLLDGDLRLYRVWQTMDNVVLNGVRTDYQQVGKYQTRNIHIYRRTTVYLRMAEALNSAGYPHFAYYLLATGVDNRVLTDSIMNHYPSDADQAYLRQFDFPTSRYVLRTVDTDSDTGGTGLANQQGIHQRGCGWCFNSPSEAYKMPFDSARVDKTTGYFLSEQDSLAELEYQKDQVELMLSDEGALELSFEGTRFYDLMRFAYRRNDPGFLAERVYKRRGEAGIPEMQGEIKVNLNNPSNWYLHWNGKIGIEPIADEQ